MLYKGFLETATMHGYNVYSYITIVDWEEVIVDWETTIVNWEIEQ